MKLTNEDCANPSKAKLRKVTNDANGSVRWCVMVWGRDRSGPERYWHLRSSHRLRWVATRRVRLLKKRYAVQRGWRKTV